MTTDTFTDFAWEQNEEVKLARANFMACAYNAAVNSDTERGRRKMGDLIRAINFYERIEGRVQLDLLVSYGVIDDWTPCSTECVVRPGGLFHVDGCENDANHPTHRARQQKAREVLPGGRDGNAGWRAAQVSLVGARTERAL